MRRRNFIGLLSFSILLAVGCGSTQNDSHQAVESFVSMPTTTNATEASTESPTKGDQIFTHSCAKGQLYHHQHYSFSYSEEDEQSEWVGYELTKEETYGTLSRSNSFTEDPMVITGSSHPYEYRQSGYSKGHLAPAGDMKFDATAMTECFYMSNMSPQTQEFNAGIWNDLEMQVRFWAKKFNSVYVITGPILKKDAPKMTYTNNRGQQEKSDITIPNEFYKIVYDYTYKGKEKMIGFIIPQDAKGDIFDYAVTVDAIESATGIDFFQNIPSKTQEALESQIKVDDWKKFTYENKYKK